MAVRCLFVRWCLGMVFCSIESWNGWLFQCLRMVHLFILYSRLCWFRYFPKNIATDRSMCGRRHVNVLKKQWFHNFVSFGMLLLTRKHTTVSRALILRLQSSWIHLCPLRRGFPYVMCACSVGLLHWYGNRHIFVCMKCFRHPFGSETFVCVPSEFG